MSSRSEFANTITSLNKRLPKGLDECFRFGITWGCQYDCPAFSKGECEDVFYENLKKFIKDGEYDKSEAIEMIQKYRPRMTEEQYSEMNKLTEKL